MLTATVSITPGTPGNHQHRLGHLTLAGQTVGIRYIAAGRLILLCMAGEAREDLVWPCALHRVPLPAYTTWG